jgi:hypothetical protein
MTDKVENTGELEAILDTFVSYFSSDWREFDENNRLGEALAAIERYVEGREIAAQENAVAWTVGLIDEIHINGSNFTGEPSTDSLFKGIKNTIRDRYRFEVGTDPAPSYPIKAQLHQSQEGK